MNVLRRVKRIIDLVVNQLLRWKLSSSDVEVSRHAILYGSPIATTAPKSRIRVGARVVLVSRSSRTALGVGRRVILRTLAPGALIDIGSDSGLSGTTICAARSVVIGRGCLLGADVLIVDTDFHPINSMSRRYEPAPSGSSGDAVRLGTNVFIGARSIVLKGVTIGDNSVIGAGSVVTNDIPPDSIAAGNPARVLGSIERSDVQ